MLVAYLYSRTGRAFVGRLSIAALAFGFGAVLAQGLVTGMSTDPGILLREYNSGVAEVAEVPPVGTDFFVPMEAAGMPQTPGGQPDQSTVPVAPAVP
jgi:hypothetical protein